MSWAPSWWLWSSKPTMEKQEGLKPSLTCWTRLLLAHMPLPTYVAKVLPRTSMGSPGWDPSTSILLVPLTKAFHCNCAARWNAYNQIEGSIFNCWDNRRPSSNFRSLRTVLQKDPVTSSLPSSTQNCHPSSPPQDGLWLLPCFWIRSDVYFTKLIPCKTTLFAVFSLLTCRTHWIRKHSVIFFLSLAAL